MSRLDRGSRLWPIPILLLLAVMATSPRVAAQTASSDSARTAALSWLRLGDPVRIQVSGDRTFDGTVSRLGPDVLQVERGDDTYVVAPSSIEGLWFRSRASKQWAITGAITGGVLGALYGGLFAILLCRSGRGWLRGGRSRVRGPRGLGRRGGRWGPRLRGPAMAPDLRPGRDPEHEADPEHPGTHRASQSSRGRGAPFLGGSLGLYTGIGRHVAFGPDIGFQGLESEESVVFITGTLRVSTERDRPFAYGLVSAGWHLWHVTVSPYWVVPLDTDPSDSYSTDLSLFAGALGAGAGVPLGNRGPALVAEVRVTKNLQNLDAQREFNIVTASAGLEFAW